MDGNKTALTRITGFILSRPTIAPGVGFLSVVAVFLLGLGIGFGAGRWTTAGSGLPPDTGQESASNASLTGARALLAPHFSLFWEALDLLYQDYHGELPDPESLTHAAIQGVIAKVDDPNTSFLAPAEAEFFRANLQGGFEGIGARVGWDEELDTLLILEPFENQPAWRGGLRRHDRIVAVDGTSLVGTDLTSAVNRIRGPQGSTVLLTIQRPETSFTFDVPLQRKRIEIPTISTETFDRIAYIRLNSFNEIAGQLVREAAHNALQREPVGMILDLRGNTGGLLREAVKVTSVFLEDAPVLIERFRYDKMTTYETSGEAVVKDIPVVVLINENSASASEIVAGALQDAGRATLLGTQSFGKGSVQMPHTLSNGAIMRITVGRWYTPTDRSIDGIGLTPDYRIAIDQQEPTIGSDLQLESALTYLRTGVITVE